GARSAGVAVGPALVDPIGRRDRLVHVARLAPPEADDVRQPLPVVGVEVGEACLRVEPDPLPRPGVDAVLYAWVEADQPAERHRLRSFAGRAEALRLQYQVADVHLAVREALLDWAARSRGSAWHRTRAAGFEP